MKEFLDILINIAPYISQSVLNAICIGTFSYYLIQIASKKISNYITNKIEEALFKTELNRIEKDKKIDDLQEQFLKVTKSLNKNLAKISKTLIQQDKRLSILENKNNIIGEK